MLRSLLVAVLAAFTFLSLIAFPAMAGKPRTHDRFFLRMTGGLGHASNQLESGGDKAKYSGYAGDGDIAVGACVSPNLALHGTFFGWATEDPDLDVTLSGVNASGTASGMAAMSAAGGGLTYFFVPANVYVSGSLGAGSFVFSPKNGPDQETKTGLAIELTAGKEWWVGNSWGLGVAAGYIHSSVGDKNVSDNWSGNSFGVRFSATFN